MHHGRNPNGLVELSYSNERTFSFLKDEKRQRTMPRVKRSRSISPQNTSLPTCANELGYLTGYRDTGSGGLSFGEDHQIVKNPANVYTVDRAFRDARTPKKDPVCEVDGCSADATYGANCPIANAKRCPAHRGETDFPVRCSIAGCTEKVRLVRTGTEEPVCLWHADPEETAYVTVRGTNTCVCGKGAKFGMGKSKMVCGKCAEVLNRALKTPFVHVLSGNCGACAKVQGYDILIRKSDGGKITVSAEEHVARPHREKRFNEPSGGKAFFLFLRVPRSNLTRIDPDQTYPLIFQRNLEAKGRHRHRQYRHRPHGRSSLGTYTCW